MTEELTELVRIELPYRRRAIVKQVVFDSGMRMTRLVIKEGTRITQVDLDDETAKGLAEALLLSVQQRLES